MPKLVLARGDITATDELVIVLSEPGNEPDAVLIHCQQQRLSPRLRRSRPLLARSPR
jgi:hypothetical protein